MKRPLVFLHGWGFDEQIWKEFINQYFSEYDVQTISLFECFDTTLNSESLLEDCCSKLTKIIKPNSLIIGWSLGALISIRLSTKLTQNDHLLCLICFNPCFVNKTEWQYGVEETLITKMIAELTNNKVSTLNRFYSLITHGATKQKESLKTIKKIISPDNLESEKLLQGLKLLKEVDLRSELESVKIQTVLCYSENDMLINKNLYKLKPFNNKKIKYSFLSNSDHIPFISSPELVAETIMKVLKDYDR